MFVFKDFPGLENVEKIQGLSRTRKRPVTKWRNWTHSTFLREMMPRPRFWNYDRCQI